MRGLTRNAIHDLSIPAIALIRFGLVKVRVAIKLRIWFAGKAFPMVGMTPAGGS
jgi:hypothetical protein